MGRFFYAAKLQNLTFVWWFVYKCLHLLYKINQMEKFKKTKTVVVGARVKPETKKKLIQKSLKDKLPYTVVAAQIIETYFEAQWQT